MDIIKAVIQNHIHKLCLKNIITAAILFFIVITILINIPFNKMFHIETLPDITKINSSAAKDYKYVQAQADTLHYSGYDYQKGDKTVGSFYYYLKNQTCIFVMIASENCPGKPEIIENYKGKATVSKNNHLVRQTIDYMANDLSWNREDLTKIIAPYYLNELDYPPLLYYILFATLILLSFITAMVLFTNILYLVKPTLHQSCRRLKRYGDINKLVCDANLEFQENIKLHSDSIYVTNHFFIELGKNSISIFPLSKITWIYRIGSWKRFLFIKLKRTYHLHITTMNSVKIKIPGKSNETTTEIISYFQSGDFQMLIGYSVEHKKMVKKL